MISRIHRRLGTAGFIIAIIALVAALCGGAYAAKGGLTKKESREVAKIAKKEAKKYAGKNGKNGKNGTNGTNGANGAKGDKGDTGATGPQGPAGPQGPQGIQGPQGVAGQTGFTATLPSEKTETGTWAMVATSEPVVYGPISFPIPLASAPQPEIVGFEEPPTANCPGSGTEPTAEPGFLCIYVLEGEIEPVALEPLPVGATLMATTGYVGRGTFAVTAE